MYLLDYDNIFGTLQRIETLIRKSKLLLKAPLVK